MNDDEDYCWRCEGWLETEDEYESGLCDDCWWEMYGR